MPIDAMSFHLSKNAVVVITCEHGGNLVPAEFKKNFAQCKDVLATHRGWDPGALDYAQALSEKLEATFYCSTITRLLVDLNRSLHHPRLFSEWTKSLQESVRQEIIEQYYLPYRTAVEAEITSIIKQRKQVLHISTHSFTPVLNGKVRKADIGILFDPARKTESEFSHELKLKLQRIFPEMNIYKNSPYYGTSDGFTTYLRTKFTSHQYVGIELEVNQKFPLDKKNSWLKFIDKLVTSFE